MINKGLLHKFFEGKTSIAEELTIRNWLDESSENTAFFFNERKLYDAVLLNKNTSTNIKSKQKKLITWSSFINVAAVVLFVITTGLLINKHLENNDNQLHTLIVPPGQRINLVLADNSSIWLNANTTFRYPTKFSKDQREVYLDGEGYFEVSANKKSPFIVNTSQGGVKVTGTNFNVSAYSKYNKFETSLFSGNVGVYLKNNEEEIINIRPSQKSKLHNGKLTVAKIKDYDEFLWRKGLIAFKNEKLEDILAVLGQYFDTTIKIETDCLPDNTYTGKFRQTDGIDYALRVLQKGIHFTYERDDEKQIIHIKNS